jgi:hypothetical protein
LYDDDSRDHHPIIIKFFVRIYLVTDSGSNEEIPYSFQKKKETLLRNSNDA